MSALYAARKCLMKEDKGFQNIELRKTDLQKIMYGIKQKTRSAANRTRTCDILVNSQTLYQLSYGGTTLLPK